MMNMRLYVQWRLYIAKKNARNMRITHFVQSGVLVRHSDSPVSASIDNVYR